ncbi:MAG: chitobiase/beta-hexosaminidase C-terminal domain-containing protein [Capsulimonadaceae bacterium]|nr:chitobiase/beta-hexosaminidase C-terminal domain-containing protein [Capsulimonadaceae bacterium]
MTNTKHLYLLILFVATLGAAYADEAPPAFLAVNKVRFTAVKGHEQDVLGAKILGSNKSAFDGFVELGTITGIPPADQESGDLTLSNKTPYRWIKYLAAPGTWGRIYDIEYFAGNQRLKAVNSYGNFEQGKWHQSYAADDQFSVIDIGDAATGPSPGFSPSPTESTGPIKVEIQNKLPGSVIRYTLDGTEPTQENSRIYTGPLTISRTTTIEASSFVDGHAPTPAVWATYIIGSPAHMTTFHLGNSLTGVTTRFDSQARTAGAIHISNRYMLGAAFTKTLWNAAMLPIGDPTDKQAWADVYNTRIALNLTYTRKNIEDTAAAWKALWPTVTHIDALTLQPRDFDIAEEADYDNRFLSLAQQKSPDLQPWLYIEWVERSRKNRPTDSGKEPTTEMTKVYPALSWEESMSAMLLYGEDLKDKVNETYKGAKPIRMIPAGIALGQLHHMIDIGLVPGFAKDDFYGKLFKDGVHLNANGSFLVDCMFYSAFYGESPEGKFLPVLTELTARQATIMQKLAWDTMTNYPFSGFYKEGTKIAGKPQFSPSAAPIKDVTTVSLASATPGAWFRYTLDGTTPTRTKGYVYCGAISARPGMTIKAIAYKSGMADSPVAEITYADGSGAPRP